MKSTIATLFALAATALAKTDLEGCTSSQTIAFGGASMVYWDPTNGEICSFLDCGGGRAPPKTTVPGCDGYTGTATYSPDFLPGWGSATATAEASSASSAESESEESSSVESSSAAGVSVPAYETKTASAQSTLMTTKAELPSGVAAGTGSLSGYMSGLTTKGSNATASHGSPSATKSAPVEATGAASHFAAPAALIMGVFGLAML